ncbi:hypothetical protein K7X08_004728 [Anisodus acutangulus]|uniref:Uncharacterized protein n=1 Tax=Anisodus acutangulus TaxID=402998 RepID=A0A9Q1MDZ0_9SOLA|nr:hypothetical protein K7X08_004728 [Anisodus acutangulus]
MGEGLDGFVSTARRRSNTGQARSGRRLRWCAAAVCDGSVAEQWCDVDQWGEGLLQFTGAGAPRRSSGGEEETKESVAAVAVDSVVTHWIYPFRVGV